MRLFAILLLAMSCFSIETVATSREDHICESTNETQICYPRIFQATNKFQTVYPEQELPPGLHVRLDMQTGAKEAKLYDPSEDDGAEVQAVEVFPQETKVMGVSGSAQSEDHTQAIIDGMAKAASQKILGSSVKPPAEAAGDAAIFQENVAVLKEAMKALRSYDYDFSIPFQAMDALEDLAHDAYWGLQVVKDRELLENLYNALTTGRSFKTVHPNPRLRLAEFQPRVFKLLGTALQNNQAAFDVFREYVSDHESRVGSFISHSTEAFDLYDLDLSTRATYFLSKILHDDDFLADFVSARGLQRLLGAAKRASCQWKHDKTDPTQRPDMVNRLQRKAVNLVEDFLIRSGEDRDRIWAVHGDFSQEKEQHLRPLSSKLAKALADRKEWCSLLHTANYIYGEYAGGLQTPEGPLGWLTISRCPPTVSEQHQDT